MKIRLAGKKNESLIDGPGISFVIFTQGCLQKCPGCHNPDAQPLDGGTELTLEELQEEINSSVSIDTLVFSGGEPFLQASALARLGSWAHEKGLRIVTYTGYTFEYLQELSEEFPEYADLLKVTDILIDGAYVAEERDLTLAYRGSKNQRILDCKLSCQGNTPITVDRYMKG